MSTASRNCGTVCSARGLGSNAPEVPGVSGKIRRHYDLRAARQLGSLKKTGPKCEPEAEIAAHASQGSAQKTTLPRRGARLRHSPPLFLPQPPPHRRRTHMNDRFRRETPLTVCPSLRCRRRKTCKGLAYDRQCLKTHFATGDDWRNHMAAKIRKFHASLNSPPPNPSLPEVSEAEALSIVYKAFEKRIAEDRAEKSGGHRKIVH